MEINKFPKYFGTKDFCINTFLFYFCRDTVSDAVCLLWKPGGSWQVRSLFREQASLSDKQITKITQETSLQEWINSQQNRWDFAEQKLERNGKNIQFLLIPLEPFRSVLSNMMIPHSILLIRPRIIDKGPYLPDVHTILLLSRNWTARANTNESRRQFLFQGMLYSDDQNKNENNIEQILQTLVWPMPYQEISNIIETGIKTGLETIKTNSFHWSMSAKIMEQLCLDGTACKLGIASRPCEASEDRKIERAILSNLIPCTPWSYLSEKKDYGFHEKAFQDGLFQIMVLNKYFLTSIQPKKLEINHSLIRFFAYHFWQDQLGAFQKRFQDKESPPGQGEKQKCLSSCTRIAQFALGGTPVNESIIEALVWALDQYGHEVLGIEPRLDIPSHLLFAARNEPGLHVLRQHYRDHFFHAVEVCFLGHLLLETHIKGRQTLADLYCKLLGFNSNREVLREWYVAALFHDIGYSVEILHGVRDLLEFLKRSEKLNALAQGIDDLFNTLSASLVWDNFEGFTKGDKPGEDHGVIGAEHLQKLIEHISQRKPNIHRYSAAQRAIAVHNHHRRVVDFESEPLSFLLILCDTIQEWNRPHFHYATAPATLLSRMLDGSSSDNRIQVTGPLESISLNLTRRADEFRMENPSMLKIDLICSEDVNKDSNVFNLWIGSTSNLQRLFLEKLPFDIRINFVTPPFIHEGKALYQMQRLREAAKETHMNFLHDWFPATDNQAVLHTVNNREYPNKEVLTIDLGELAKKQPITASMKTFWKKLSQWRRFYEDRDFSGDYAPATPG